MSFLLVPCLLADPVTVHALIAPAPAHASLRRSAPGAQDLFSEQALTLRFVEMVQPVGSFIRVRGLQSQLARRVRTSLESGWLAHVDWRLVGLAAGIGVFLLVVPFHDWWMLGTGIVGYCDRQFIDWRLQQQEENARDYEEEERNRKEREAKDAEEREKEKKRQADEFEEALNEFTDKLETVINSEERINEMITKAVKHDLRFRGIERMNALNNAKTLSRKEVAAGLSQVWVKEGIIGAEYLDALRETLESNAMVEEMDKLTGLTKRYFRPLKATVAPPVFVQHEHTHEGLTHARMHARGVEHHHHQQANVSPRKGASVFPFMLSVTLVGAALWLGVPWVFHHPELLRAISHPQVWASTLMAVGAAFVGAGGNGAQDQDAVGETQQDLIRRYTVNLTEMAKTERFPESPYIEKIQDLDARLGGGLKKNAVLVGDPRATLEFVKAVASEVANNKSPEQIPEHLRGREILYFNVPSLLSLLAESTKYEGTIQDLNEALEKAVNKNGKKYIFVFDFQQMYWVSKERGELIKKVSDLFGTVLKERKIPVIGLCNEKDYGRFSTDNQEYLSSGFERIDIKNPSNGKAEEFLQTFLRQAPANYPGLAQEDIQRVQMDAASRLKAIDYVRKFMPYGDLPGRLTEMLDQILTERMRQATIRRVHLEALRSRIHQAVLRYKEALAKQDVPEQRHLEDLMGRYHAEAKALQNAPGGDVQDGVLTINVDQIVELISQEIRIPAADIVHKASDKLTNYVENIRKRLIGQVNAVAQTHLAFKRRNNNLGDPNLPIGAFIFVGPTGVGKTEMAKAIAAQYFGNEKQIIRLDMSEYMDAESKNKLIGSPPGYIGYEAGGQLTNAMLRNPYNVVLMDEIEKAHPDIYKLMLQVLDKGVLTDGHQRTVSFKNTIIIMTSNLGMTPQIYEMYEAVKIMGELSPAQYDQLRSALPLYQHPGESESETVSRTKDGKLMLDALGQLHTFPPTVEAARDEILALINQRVDESVRRFFGDRPEFMPRLDMLGSIIVFDQLTAQDLDSILNIKLAQKNAALADRKLKLILTPELRAEIIRLGYDPKNNGARPLERAFNRMVLAGLARNILSDQYLPGDEITAGFENGVVTFHAMHPEVQKERTLDPVILELQGVISSGGALDDALIKKLFGMENLQRTPTPITDPKGWQLDSPLNMEEKLAEFKAQFQQENGRVPTADEDQKLKVKVEKAKQKEQEAINGFFRNLSAEALADTSVATARGADTSKLIRVLEQRERNYPFLVNRSGAALEDFVHQVSAQCVKGDIPGYDKQRFLKLRLERFSRDVALLGTMEDQIRRLLDVIEADDTKKGLRTTLMIDFDELARVVAVYRGRYGDDQMYNLGFFMMPFMGRKNIRLVMTTTFRDIGTNEAFPHYFTEVDVPELKPTEALEHFHLFGSPPVDGKAATETIAYSFQTLADSVRLFAKEISGTPMIEALERFFDYVRGKRFRGSDALKTGLARAKEQIRRIVLDIMDDRRRGDKLSEDKLLQKPELLGLIRQVRTLEAQLSGASGAAEPMQESDAQDFLVDRFQRDRRNLSVDEKANLLALEDHLNAKIVDQQEAIHAFGDAIRIGKVGLKPAGKPIGSFILAGPTGVGKTEVVTQLAAELGLPILQFDMTEYTDAESVNKLIGPPPGYVGHNERDMWLTTRVKKQPRSILLFDEIDKLFEKETQVDSSRGKTVLDILLQMLDDGRLTDSAGNTVDFSETIIFFTSNGGMTTKIERLPDGRAQITKFDGRLYAEIGKVAESDDETARFDLQMKIHEQVEAYHHYYLRPEFMNRLDGFFVFNPFTRPALERVTSLIVGKKSELKKEDYELVFGRTPEEHLAVVRHLMAMGYRPDAGARGVKALVYKDLMDEIGKFTESRPPLKKRDRLIVGFDAATNHFTFEVEAAPELSLKAHLGVTGAESQVLNQIASGINDIQGQPDLQVKDIDPWLSLVPQPPKNHGKPLALTDQAHRTTLKDNNPSKLDPQYKKERTEMLQAAESAEVSKPVRDVLRSWMDEALTVARRENIQQTAWATAGRVDDFYNMETGQVKKLVDSNLEAANQGHFVDLGWQIVSGELRVQVQFNSIFTNNLYRLLFEDTYADEKSIPRQLQGLLMAQAALKTEGATLGFHSEPGQPAALWITLPISGPGANVKLNLAGDDTGAKYFNDAVEKLDIHVKVGNEVPARACLRIILKSLDNPGQVEELRSRIDGVRLKLDWLKTQLGTLPNAPMSLNLIQQILDKLVSPAAPAKNRARADTSLLGLSRMMDHDNEPVPGLAISPGLLDRAVERLTQLNSSLAKRIPQITLAYWGGFMHSYAAIHREPGETEPILYMEAFHEKSADPALDHAVGTLQAILLGHEGMQFTLRQTDSDVETGSARLTEEIALFAEVDAVLWRALSSDEQAELLKLADTLDESDISKEGRVKETLDRLKRFSQRPEDAEETWKDLAKELQTYPKYRNQTLDLEQLKAIRTALRPSIAPAKPETANSTFDQRKTLLTAALRRNVEELKQSLSPFDNRPIDEPAASFKAVRTASSVIRKGDLILGLAPKNGHYRILRAKSDGGTQFENVQTGMTTTVEPLEFEAGRALLLARSQEMELLHSGNDLWTRIWAEFQDPTLEAFTALLRQVNGNPTLVLETGVDGLVSAIKFEWKKGRMTAVRTNKGLTSPYDILQKLPAFVEKARAKHPESDVMAFLQLLEDKALEWMQSHAQSLEKGRATEWYLSIYSDLGALANSLVYRIVGKKWVADIAQAFSKGSTDSPQSVWMDYTAAGADIVEATSIEAGDIVYFKAADGWEKLGRVAEARADYISVKSLKDPTKIIAKIPAQEFQTGAARRVVSFEQLAHLRAVDAAKDIRRLGKALAPEDVQAVLMKMEKVYDSKVEVTRGTNGGSVSMTWRKTSLTSVVMPPTLDCDAALKTMQGIIDALESARGEGNRSAILDLLPVFQEKQAEWLATMSRARRDRQAFNNRIVMALTHEDLTDYEAAMGSLNAGTGKLGTSIYLASELVALGNVKPGDFLIVDEGAGKMKIYLVPPLGMPGTFKPTNLKRLITSEEAQVIRLPEAIQRLNDGYQLSDPTTIPKIIDLLFLVSGTPPRTEISEPGRPANFEWDGPRLVSVTFPEEFEPLQALEFIIDGLGKVRNKDRSKPLEDLLQPLQKKRAVFGKRQSFDSDTWFRIALDTLPWANSYLISDFSGKSIKQVCVSLFESQWRIEIRGLIRIDQLWGSKKKVMLSHRPDPGSEWKSIDKILPQSAFVWMEQEGDGTFTLVLSDEMMSTMGVAPADVSLEGRRVRVLPESLWRRENPAHATEILGPEGASPAEPQPVGIPARTQVQDTRADAAALKSLDAALTMDDNTIHLEGIAKSDILAALRALGVPVSPGLDYNAVLTKGLWAQRELREKGADFFKRARGAATSILGLSNSRPHDLLPVPGNSVPVEQMRRVKARLASLSPAMAEQIKGYEDQALFALDMHSYAAIDAQPGGVDRLLYFDDVMEKVPSSEALELIQALLLGHEGMQYKLRQGQTESADLTEELALFMEVDLALWKRIEPAQREALFNLAKQLDALDPEPEERLTDSLNRLERFAKATDEEARQGIAEALEAYPKYRGQGVDDARLKQLRDQLQQLSGNPEESRRNKSGVAVEDNTPAVPLKGLDRGALENLMEGIAPSKILEKPDAANRLLGQVIEEFNGKMRLDPLLITALESDDPELQVQAWNSIQAHPENQNNDLLLKIGMEHIGPRTTNARIRKAAWDGLGALYPSLKREQKDLLLKAGFDKEMGFHDAEPGVKAAAIGAIAADLRRPEIAEVFNYLFGPNSGLNVEKEPAGWRAAPLILGKMLPVFSSDQETQAVRWLLTNLDNGSSWIPCRNAWESVGYAFPSLKKDVRSQVVDLLFTRESFLLNGFKKGTGLGSSTGVVRTAAGASLVRMLPDFTPEQEQRSVKWLFWSGTGLQDITYAGEGSMVPTCVEEAAAEVLVSVFPLLNSSQKVKALDWILHKDTGLRSRTNPVVRRSAGAALRLLWPELNADQINRVFQAVFIDKPGDLEFVRDPAAAEAALAVFPLLEETIKSKALNWLIKRGLRSASWDVLSPTAEALDSNYSAFQTDDQARVQNNINTDWLLHMDKRVAQTIAKALLAIHRDKVASRLKPLLAPFRLSARTEPAAPVAEDPALGENGDRYGPPVPPQDGVGMITESGWQLQRRLLKARSEENLNRSSWSPNGEFLAINSNFYGAPDRKTSSDWTLWRCDAEGNPVGEPIRRHFKDQYTQDMVWHPKESEWVSRVSRGMQEKNGQLTPVCQVVSWRVEGDKVVADPVPIVELDESSPLLEWSPDGTFLAIGTHSGISGTGPGKVRIFQRWPNGKFTEPVILTGVDLKAITSLSWSPDSQSLLVTSSGGDPVLWNRNPDGSMNERAEILQNGVGAQGFSWSPKNQYLIAGTPRGQIIRWQRDAQDRWIMNGVEIISGETRNIQSFAWSPDGRHVVGVGVTDEGDSYPVYTGGDLYLIATEGPDRWVVQKDALSEPAGKDPIRTLIWSPDGSQLHGSTYASKAFTWFRQGDGPFQREGVPSTFLQQNVSRLSFSPSKNGLAMISDYKNVSLCRSPGTANAGITLSMLVPMGLAGLMSVMNWLPGVITASRWLHSHPHVWIGAFLLAGAVAFGHEIRSPQDKVQRILANRTERPEPEAVVGLKVQDLAAVVGPGVVDRYKSSRTFRRLQLMLRSLLNIIVKIHEDYAHDTVLFMGRDAENLYDAYKTYYDGNESAQKSFLLPGNIWFWMWLQSNLSEQQQMEYLARFGITREAIESGKRFMIFDTGWKGNVARLIRETAVKLYGLDEGVVKRAFPAHLVYGFYGGSDAWSLYFEVDTREKEDGPNMDLFPDPEDQRPLDARFAKDPAYRLAVALQILPRYHGKQTYFKYEDGRVVMVPKESPEDFGEDIDVFRHHNQDIINPGAALMVQMRIVDYFHQLKERESSSMTHPAVLSVLKEFEPMLEKGWAEIAAKGILKSLSDLHMQADKDWGINFFKGALYRSNNSREPRVIFEFERLGKRSGMEMPAPGTMYFDVESHAFKLIWRSVDFRTYPPSHIYVQNVDPEVIQKQLREAGWDFPVETWTDKSLNPNAYYHSRPVTSMKTVLDFGALVTRYEAAYRYALQDAMRQVFFASLPFASLDAAQIAFVRDQVVKVLSRLLSHSSRDGLSLRSA